MSTWGKKNDDKSKEVRRGHEWIMSRGEGRGIVRAIYDTNEWKSFVQARLSTPMGDSGSLALNGDNPEAHRLLADHLTAEYRTETFGHGRRVWQWSVRPDRKDNHWLDCLVGAAVAASMEGCGLLTENKPATRRVAQQAKPSVNLQTPDGRSFFITNRRD